MLVAGGVEVGGVWGGRGVRSAEEQCSKKPICFVVSHQIKRPYRPNHMSAPQQFFVRGLDNKSHTVTLDPGLTVRQVKEAIALEKGNVPADQIRLVFGGKELQDSSKIADYNIGPGTNVNMVLRLQGGI